MNEWLTALAELIKNNLWIAPFLSLAAGILTSFTPCSLSTVPVVLAYVGSTSGSDTKKAFRLSLAMASGMAVTFGILGSVVSVIGHFMHEAGMWWYIVLGIVMILMALQTWEVIHILPQVQLKGKAVRKGYFGAFLAGMVSGAFASHCATPVMIALLALAAQSGKTLWSVFLLALYAVGHSILLLAAGTGYSVAERWMKDPRYAGFGKKLRIILGLIILLIGIFMIFMAFGHEG